MSKTPQMIGIAVVESGGRFLVGRRDGDGPLAGYDEFPGGKCEPGEPPDGCAVRECAEETGLLVEAVELLLREEFTYEHGSVDLNFYLCRPSNPGDVAEEQNGYRWVAAAQLTVLNFPPANETIIRRLTAI